MEKNIYVDEEFAPVAKRERWRWTSHTKFIMQAIGTNEGLINIGQFSHYLAANGNGAFLIPYLVVKIIFGIPITYMLMALGQYADKGPLDVWLLCPLAHGVGYGVLFLSSYTLIVHNTWVTYSLFYFFSSFQSQLPWFTCDHAWAKQNCMVRKMNATTTANCMKEFNFSVCRDYLWETASQHFWTVHVLGHPNGEDIITNGTGEFMTHLLLCLAFSCFLVFVMLSRGQKVMEKVISICTIYPLVGLSAMLFVSFLDTGAGRGLGLLLKLDFAILVRGEAWKRAYEMVVESSNLGTGVLIMLGSYCTFRNPIHMDSITINIVDIFVAIGCGIFSFNCIGIIAYHFGLHPNSVMQSGYNIPFVLVPEAMEYLPGNASFWSLVYFSSIFCFGMTTQYFLLVSSLSVLYDRFPRTMDYPVIVSATACFLLFLLGIPLCSANGTHLATAMELFVCGPFQASMVTIQVFVVLWVYAMGRFADDVHFMLGFRPSNFFQACWLIAPLFSLTNCIFIYQSTESLMVAQGSNPLLELLCWILFYNIPIASIVLVGIYTTIRYYMKKKLRQVIRPDPDFGPNDPVLMKSRRMFSAQAMTKEYMYRQSRLGAHGRLHQVKSSTSESASLD